MLFAAILLYVQIDNNQIGKYMIKISFQHDIDGNPLQDRWLTTDKNVQTDPNFRGLTISPDPHIGYQQPITMNKNFSS